MEWSIWGVKIKSVGPVDIEAGSGICEGARGITGIFTEEEEGSIEEEGVGASDAEVEGASDLLPLAFLGPLKVTVGSSRFQQFFLI